MSIFLPLLSYSFWRLRNIVISRLYRERWTIFFGDTGQKSTDTFLAEVRPRHLRQLQMPDDRFWADPHLFVHKGKTFVFFEDASTHSGFGRLATISVNEDGSVSEAVTILEEKHHLSYPFIFEWQDDIFLLPEAGTSGSITLYRCISFPDKWIFEQHLIEDILAYDATIYFYNDLWWMFVNIQSHDGASSWDELCLYYADNPISSNWQPHRQNPIVSDVRSARPAGSLFESNGKLFRPAQNSSFRYGYGVNLMEVTELSINSYQEQLVESIVPTNQPNVMAMHTYNRRGNFVVTDAIMRERR